MLNQLAVDPSRNARDMIEKMLKGTLDPRTDTKYGSLLELAKQVYIDIPGIMDNKEGMVVYTNSIYTVCDTQHQ